MKAVQSGLLSLRPASNANAPGQLYVATDEHALHFDNGSSWKKVAAAPLAVERIRESILAQAASAVVFASIPQTYRHLEIRWQALGGGSAFTLVVSFNGDTAAAHYYMEALWAEGTTVYASQNIGTGYNGLYVAYVHGSYNAAGSLLIPSYVGGARKNLISTYQSIFGTGAGQTLVGHYGGWWNSTAAISSITVTASQNMGANSVFTLYGLQ